MNDWILIILTSVSVCSVEVPPQCTQESTILVEDNLEYVECQYKKFWYPKENVVDIWCEQYSRIAGVEEQHLMSREKQAKIIEKEILQ